MTEKIPIIRDNLFAPERADLSEADFPRMPCRKMCACNVQQLAGQVPRGERFGFNAQTMHYGLLVSFLRFSQTNSAAIYIRKIIDVRSKTIWR